MGFVNSFMYGVSQTAPILAKEKATEEENYQKAQDDADAQYQLRVKSVDPETQLYQRQQDIKLADDEKARRQRMNDELIGLQNQSSALQADQASIMGTQPSVSTNTPAPTITQGAAPNMAPTGSTTPQPFTPATPTTVAAPVPVDHFALKNEYDAMAARAFGAGDKEGAERWQHMANMHKEAYEHEALINKAEPVPNKSAEGTNVNEQLVKDADANDKVNGTSFYAPETASVFAQPDSTMNWKGDKYYAENVHTPLAQAEMVHQRALDPTKPETEVFGIVKQNTLVPTSDIATLELNNPHITAAQKLQAMTDLMGYMKSTYGNDVDAAIAKDKNLQHVFNTKLLNTMTSIANEGKVQPPATNGD